MRLRPRCGWTLSLCSQSAHCTDLTRAWRCASSKRHVFCQTCYIMAASVGATSCRFGAGRILYVHVQRCRAVSITEVV